MSDEPGFETDLPLPEGFAEQPARPQIPFKEVSWYQAQVGLKEQKEASALGGDPNALAALMDLPWLEVAPGVVLRPATLATMLTLQKALRLLPPRQANDYKKSAETAFYFAKPLEAWKLLDDPPAFDRAVAEFSLPLTAEAFIVAVNWIEKGLARFLPPDGEDGAKGVSATLGSPARTPRTAKC